MQKDYSSILVGDLVYIKGEKDKTKARAKYLVTAISEPWCKLRKFVGSQLRSKVYDIKLSECYPVTPTVLGQFAHGPVRGLDPPDGDDEQGNILDYAFHMMYPVLHLRVTTMLLPLLHLLNRMPSQDLWIL